MEGVGSDAEARSRPTSVGWLRWHYLMDRNVGDWRLRGIVAYLIEWSQSWATFAPAIRRNGMGTAHRHGLPAA